MIRLTGTPKKRCLIFGQPPYGALLPNPLISVIPNNRGAWVVPKSRTQFWTLILLCFTLRNAKVDLLLVIQNQGLLNQFTCTWTPKVWELNLVAKNPPKEPKGLLFLWGPGTALWKDAGQLSGADYPAPWLSSEFGSFWDSGSAPYNEMWLVCRK